VTAAVMATSSGGGGGGGSTDSATARKHLSECLRWARRIAVRVLAANVAATVAMEPRCQALSRTRQQ
tara:strand:+ start:1630 stop:1830 length:201 start_codon:yes stop_codon:yes gene_type:complete